MAPAARPAFLKGAGGPPSIEAAGHLLGPTPGDQSEQALLPSRPRWRRCSCCRVGARCAPGPGPPQASLLRSCRGTGQGVRATVLRPVVGCTCPARATGPCPRAPAAGCRGRAGALAVGFGPASTTRQHDNTTTQQRPGRWWPGRPMATAVASCWDSHAPAKGPRGRPVAGVRGAG
jgi:hypothetical protein